MRFANTVFIFKSKVELDNFGCRSFTILNAVAIVRLNSTACRGRVFRIRGGDFDTVDFDVFDKTELLVGVELACRILFLLVFCWACTTDFGDNVLSFSLEIRVVKT